MLIRTEHLSNGLAVEFHDLSNRYFGDYHRVAVEVRCRIPLAAAAFAGAADPAAEMAQARRLLGAEVLYSRTLEKMGVAGAEVEQAVHLLVESFIRSSFSYLESSAFPGRLITTELERRRKVRRPFLTRA